MGWSSNSGWNNSGWSRAAAGGGGGAVTINDTFDRANSATGLGTSSDGTWSWTDTGNTMGIISNQAYSVNATGANCVSRAETDLSSTDHYAQVTLVTLPSGTTCWAGACARFSASAQTCYVYLWRASSQHYELYKIVAGTATSLAVGTATVSAGDVLKIVCSGSTISGYRNGSLDVSISDTSITTGTRTGLFMSAVNSSGFRLDNFTASG